MSSTNSMIALLCASCVLAGCSESNNNAETPVLGQALLADATPSSVADQLITGSNSADNETQWQCDLSNKNQTANNYVLSFWADRAGVAGKESMSWFPIDTDSVSITWGKNQIVLTNFLFSEDSENIKFSAVSDRNDRLDCELNGPRPATGGVLQDYAPLADSRIVNSRSNTDDSWVCSVSDNVGHETERHYSFWRDGVGTSDTGNFTWYYNDDENIIASYDDHVRELRSIRYSDDTENPSSFTAFDRQFSLNCQR